MNRDESEHDTCQNSMKNKLFCVGIESSPQYCVFHILGEVAMELKSVCFRPAYLRPSA